ncbi:MAG: GNAT family N-acetyltransferase [Acidimicrobiales bacterium]|nr:GNAT family N-acetyltransferase [Acidimicrobiales bacterium]MCB9394797.1 GNAT family N-acetyltransferase [Acidimicrobiaceae bacterium]
MTHPVWPLFDLRVTTPRLELRYVDDELALALAELAARGVHDRDFMPFTVAWTDVEPPQLEVNTMQYYWRCRAEWSPTSWNLNLAVVVDGTVVGTTGAMAHDFATVGGFETGSWLGREFHGRGIGTEMRLATLQLMFAGFDARAATTGAFADNGPSLGVTAKLGYTPNGGTDRARRGTAARSLHFHMPRAHWEEHLRRDDIELHGTEACRALFGAR